MRTVKKDFLIKKNNVLNEIRTNHMTLQELRFFAIYLSRINPKDMKTRVVRFSIADFQAIMELGSRIKIDYMKKVTNSLLCKVVNVPNERGGYTSFQLFKECIVDMDEENQWYVEIDAHDKALPLMFDYKNKYFSYRLFNILRLASSNQLRMYEILKQYETIGSRVMSVEEIKEYLGINKNEYPRFNDFKCRVLDSCQQALKENTDIRFTYGPDPNSKRGRGGKINKLKFNIEKNNDYVNRVTFDIFLNEKKLEVDADAGSCENEDENELSPYDSKIKFLSNACNNEFNIREISVLYDIMVENLPHSTICDDIACYNHMMRMYREMEMRNEKSEIKHRFAYIKSIIGTE